MAKNQLNVDIGIRLKMYRYSLGLSQAEIAAIIEISQPQYALIENGNAMFRVEHIEKLVTKKNFNPNYIFGLDKNHTFDKKVVKLPVSKDVVFMS